MKQHILTALPVIGLLTNPCLWLLVSFKTSLDITGSTNFYVLACISVIVSICGLVLGLIKKDTPITTLSAVSIVLCFFAPLITAFQIAVGQVIS